MALMHVLDPALGPERIVADLDPAARDVIASCRELYAGDWDDMAEDLRRRQSGQPYLFKLQLEPGQALAWVERFKAYETASGQCLADALPGEEPR